MAYWLIKTEPTTWSWQDQTRDGTTCWDGVRNAQASNHLKAMAAGDRCLFYHSGKDKQIVGVVEVVKPYYADPSDESGRFGMVDVRAVGPLKRPVTLTQVKAEPTLERLALVRQPRLSVMPVDAPAWKKLLAMGGGVAAARG